MITTASYMVIGSIIAFAISSSHIQTSIIFCQSIDNILSSYSLNLNCMNCVGRGTLGSEPVFWRPALLPNLIYLSFLTSSTANPVLIAIISSSNTSNKLVAISIAFSSFPSSFPSSFALLSALTLSFNIFALIS